MTKIKKSRKASRWVKRPHTCEVLHPILTMETANKPLASIDDLMDAEFGKIGTRQREAFRKEAYDYCVKSNLERKQKKIRNRIQQQNKTVYIMNDLQEKAKVGFYCNRPYGIRIDYAQKGFVLFNRYANTLGNRETGSIEKLPLESFEDVNEIPLDGILVQNGNHTTDVYFYSEESNPYRNAILNLEALKQYNRFIYPLSILLNRTL